MLRIILIGPPGSGKGTQSQFISGKYNIPQISTGNILRSEIYSKTPTGKKIKKLIDTGKLINDNIIINLIKKILNKKKYKNNFLLDGFPRTMEQAICMKNYKIFVNYVLEFKLCEKLIFERLSGRRIHIPSGRIYNINYNPSKIVNKDDITNEKLSIRQDDTEKIIKNRLNEYYKLTKPLLSFYKDESIKGNIKYFQLNCEKNPKDISKEIEKILK